MGYPAVVVTGQVPGGEVLAIDGVTQDVSFSMPVKCPGNDPGVPELYRYFVGISCH